MELIHNKRIEDAKEFIERQDVIGWQDVIANGDGGFKFENPEKRFYVLCWWDNGANGSFCDRDELVDALLDGLTRFCGESFSVIIYDLDEECEVTPVITEIELQYEEPSFTGRIRVRRKAN